MLLMTLEKLAEQIFKEFERDGEVLLELRVAPSDMGKVIGRQGRIAKDIRTLIKSAAMRENKRVSVDIID